VKTTNCLLAPTSDELPAPPPPQACIRCGICAEACPASLLPQQLFWFAQAKEHDKLEAHNLFDCIECGACSWVCPSNIPLVQYYRASKAEILRLRADNERAEQSRQRFEARQQRLEREAAEKEARRLARKQAAEQRSRQQAAQGAGTDDPVQAAIERARAKKAEQSQAATGGVSDERERLEKAVVTAEKRLATATARLGQAEADGADTVDALRTGVNKTRQKLEQAREALRNHPSSQGENAGAPGNSVDPAQDAIAKAIAARQAEEALDPDEQARIQLVKLEQRLAASRDRLEAAREAGEAEKIVDALSASVERLEAKVAAARQAQQTEVS
jgi:electron transport complex protein RnfC